MRRVNGYNKISDFIRDKVSNLKMDIDDTEKNPFVTGDENTGYDETGEINEMDRFPSSSSRRGSEDTTYRSPHSRTYGETSFIEGIDEHTPLITKESKRDEAWDEVRRKFPKVDTTKFTATLNEIGQVFVKLIRENASPNLYSINMTN